MRWKEDRRGDDWLAAGAAGVNSVTVYIYIYVCFSITADRGSITWFMIEHSWKRKMTKWLVCLLMLVSTTFLPLFITTKDFALTAHPEKHPRDDFPWLKWGLSIGSSIPGWTDDEFVWNIIKCIQMWSLSFLPKICGIKTRPYQDQDLFCVLFFSTPEWNPCVMLQAAAKMNWMSWRNVPRTWHRGQSILMMLGFVDICGVYSIPSYKLTASIYMYSVIFTCIHSCMHAYVCIYIYIYISCK